MKLSRTACPLLLLGLLLGLLRLGDERLTVPLHSLSALSGWMSNTPPIDMAAALLRQAGIVLAAYLLATTTVALVAEALGCRRVAVVVLRAGVPTALRRLVSGTAGLGLAAGSVVLSNTAQAAASQPAVTVLAEDPPYPATPTPHMAVLGQESSPPRAATMQLLTDEPAASTSTTATMLLLEEPPAEPPTTPAAPQTVALTDEDWVVESGDSFWSIAEEMLSDYQGPGGDEIDVAMYCRQLIAANRDRLATPNEPNLLFPGQVLTVPPPAS